MEQFASAPSAIEGALPVGGRFYYDSCFDPRVYKPIAQGESITHPLGYFEGADVSGVRAEVQAVILEDGSTSGAARWIDALFARRIRHYDRLRSVHDLLAKQVHAGFTREEILEKLRATKVDVDNERPDHIELRSVDDLVLLSAIRTLEMYGKEGDSYGRVKWYVEQLGEQSKQMEQCGPAMDTIRARLAEHPQLDSLPPPGRTLSTDPQP
jgi:hypothetical protein